MSQASMLFEVIYRELQTDENRSTVSFYRFKKALSEVEQPDNKAIINGMDSLQIEKLFYDIAEKVSVRQALNVEQIAIMIYKELMDGGLQTLGAFIHRTIDLHWNKGGHLFQHYTLTQLNDLWHTTGDTVRAERINQSRQVEFLCTWFKYNQHIYKARYDLNQQFWHLYRSYPDDSQPQELTVHGEWRPSNPEVLQVLMAFATERDAVNHVTG